MATSHLEFESELYMTGNPNAASAIPAGLFVTLAASVSITSSAGSLQLPNALVTDAFVTAVALEQMDATGATADPLGFRNDRMLAGEVSAKAGLGHELADARLELRRRLNA